MSAVCCPPSCRSRCTVEHHPLLVATLNCPTDASEAALTHWRNVVLGFQQTDKWGWSLPIPDAVDAYRMPILHWACYLGKVSIIKYMLRCSGSGTGYRSVALPPTERSVYSQLVQGDVSGGNTPVHLCCEMLANTDKEAVHRGNKYIRCLDQLLYFMTARHQESARDGLQWANVVNCRNSAGDTPLHIVCRNDALHTVVRQLIGAGADQSIVSSCLTPLDIARQCRNAQIVHVLSNVDTILQDDFDDEDFEPREHATDAAIDLLPRSVIHQLSLQQTLSSFGLTVSAECTMAELEHCLLQLQQSNDVNLIESVRSAVLANLKQVEQHRDSLLARLAEIDVKSSALDAKHKSDVEEAAELGTKLEISSKKRKQLAKETRRSELRVESFQAKRKVIARKLAELKDNRR